MLIYFDDWKKKTNLKKKTALRDDIMYAVLIN